MKLFRSQNGNDSCQLLTRKRRRGVIEKKRRDRINTSLCELKRLVPAACEKQGSAKLEKAEILQLTVDHLKMLHAKGQSLLSLVASRTRNITINIDTQANKNIFQKTEYTFPIDFGTLNLNL